METEISLESLLAGTLRTQGFASQFLSSEFQAVPLQRQAVDNPLYWVNVLRGRVTKRLMVKLQDTLIAQGNEFLDQFIKYNGISYLLDVHEDLFWRTFERKDKGKDAIDGHEAKQAFLECTGCLQPLLHRPMGLKAFTEGSKKTLHQQIVLLVTSLGNRKVRKTCIWAIHTIASHCPLSRVADWTNAFFEGLVSLQALLGEQSVFATLLRILSEEEDTGSLAQGLFLLNLAVEGASGDSQVPKHLKTRERMRKALESCGLQDLLENLSLKGNEEINEEIKKWKERKARDEQLLNRKHERKVVRHLRDDDSNMYETTDVVPKRKGKVEVVAVRSSGGGGSEMTPAAAVIGQYLDEDEANDFVRQLDSKSAKKDEVKEKEKEKEKDGYMAKEEQDRLGGLVNPDVDTNMYAQEEDLADFIRKSRNAETGEEKKIQPSEDVGNAKKAADHGYLNEDEQNQLRLGDDHNAQKKGDTSGDAYLYTDSTDTGPFNPSPRAARREETQDIGVTAAASPDLVSVDSVDPLDDLYHTPPETFFPDLGGGTSSYIVPTTGGEGDLYLFMKQQLNQANYKPDGKDDKQADGSVLEWTIAKPTTTTRAASPTTRPTESQPTAPKFDLRSLVSEEKRGELYAWSVRLRIDPATGTPAPHNEFDTMVVEMNRNTLTVTDKHEKTDLEKLDEVTRMYKEASGPGLFTESLAVSIPLGSIIKVRAFEKGNTKGWENKFGFVVTYRLAATDKNQKLTLVATSEAEQQWWMKAIVMHKALTRDWNESFQHVMKELREQILASAATFVEEGEATGEAQSAHTTGGSSGPGSSAAQAADAFTAPQLLRSLTSMGESGAFKPPLVADMLESSGSSTTRRKPLKGKDKGGRESEQQVSPRSSSKPTKTTTGPKVTDLVLEFTQIAEVLAQIIVDELHHPDYAKLIPPAKLGGVAGGEKYISHGILFKFAIDFRGLYGGDEYAMKATQHEIKGLTAYIKYALNSRFPDTLHFPIMTVIDYKGYRLSATSILPVGSDTLIYGSADGGKTVLNKYKEMSALMKKAGRALNIKPHWVIPMDKQWRERRGVARVQICGPGDIEGHLGTDKRFYVLDTARVFPPTTPAPELRGSFLYRLMRPEFVKNYRTPLCSDGFSRWAHDADDPSVLQEHNEEIRAATNEIVEKAVPEFARRFESIFKRIYHGQDSGSEMWRTAPDYSRYMVIDMHRAGINVRYIGHLRKHTTNALLNKWLLMEMSSRVVKNRLRELMRQVRTANEEDTRDVVAGFLHRLLHDPTFWQSPERGRQQQSAGHDFDVKHSLRERFPSCFYSNEENDNWDLRAHVHIGAVFGRVSRLLGLRFTDQFEDQLWRWVDADCVGEVASAEAFKQALVSISPTVAQLPLVSHSRAKKLERLADSAYASTKNQQLQFLVKAKDEYLLGMEMKTDDPDLVVGLVKVLLRAAKLLQSQIEDQSRPEIVRILSIRIQRMVALAERQLKEALRIDGTRADILATYAVYLAEHAPKKREKAEKYFEMALQASPYDSVLVQRYRSFKGEAEPVASSPGAHSRAFPPFPTPPPALERKMSALGDRLSKRMSRAHSHDAIAISAPIAVSTSTGTVQIHKRLCLTIVCARNLAAMDTNGMSDPYCIVTLGHQTHKTDTKKKTLNPQWNETFNLVVESGQEPLKVEVWDWDRITKDDFIGERVIAIAELLRESKEPERWYGLCPANASRPDPSLGEIKLAFKWS